MLAALLIPSVPTSKRVRNPVPMLALDISGSD